MRNPNYIKTKPNSQLEWVSDYNEVLTFDAKFGFTLSNTKTLDLYSSSLFRCSVKESDYTEADETAIDHQFVYFNVTKVGYIPKISYPLFVPRKNLWNNASAGFDITAAHYLLSMFKCCSDVPETPPQLFVVHCQTTVGCKILQNRINWDNLTIYEKYISVVPGTPTQGFSDCVEAEINSPSAFVICHGQNVDFMKYYVKQFDPKFQEIETSRNASFQSNVESVSGNQLEDYKGKYVSLTKCKL